MPKNAKLCPIDENKDINITPLSTETWNVYQSVLDGFDKTTNKID